MRFWDSSAVIPLCLREASTSRLMPLSRDASPLSVWWATAAECESALARRERGGGLTDEAARYAREELEQLEDRWVEVAPTLVLRDLARRLLRIHPLRAADAFQLASALMAADGDPASLPFVCLDDRLNEAARREGFPVVP